MAITPNPFVLRDVELSLTKVDGGNEIQFRCQLSQAQLTPSTGTGVGNTLETFCQTYSDSSTLATWTLDLAGFQAYESVDDFSVLSFNEEGELFDFSLIPLGGVVSATNPAFGGQVTMVATQIGGTANQYATFTASLPCARKPDMLVDQV